MTDATDVQPASCSSQYGRTSLEADEAAKRSDAKYSIVKRLWVKTGIEVPMIMLAMKGALPPIICLAAYQADAWALEYTTLGYLTAIMSIFAMAILPRARFLQTMILSLFFTCLGAAVALLEIQCAVAARQNTTPSAAGEGTFAGSSGSQQSVAYNSSASTVAGVFLFFTIYTANSLRAYRPQMALPLVQYSIFTIVASTYAAQFPNMKEGESFVRRLLETFLTGFGIATGVSLFVLPLTSRTIADKQLENMIKLMQASIRGNAAHTDRVSMRSQDTLWGIGQIGTQKSKMGGEKKRVQAPVDGISAEAKAMKGVIEQMGALFGKISPELSFAKREIAYGKLSPDDYSDIKNLLRDILLPIFGISTLLDAIQLVKENEDRVRAGIENSDILAAIPTLESDEWDEIMEFSRKDHVSLKAAMLGGLQHVAHSLEFAKKPRPAPNDEENTDATQHAPDGTYGAHLEEALHAFHLHRVQGIQRWCENKGIGLLAAVGDGPSHRCKDQSDHAILRQQFKRQHIYLMLYLGYMTCSMGKAILKMVRFADSKVDDQTMTKRRLIIPTYRRLKKFVTYIFKSVDSENVGYDGENTGTTIYVGDMLKPKDSEHLPPSNFYQNATDQLRVIPHILGSNSSAFGFRVAVATLSIGVTSYLLQTYAFFIRERVLWALMMVALGMSAQAGQGIFGFAARILGTAVAMCASLVLWYMGGEQTAAILPLFYIGLCFGVLLLIKKPERAIVAITSMTTAVIIIGYELQERKIGLVAATSNDQPYYPIYILGPYRLAAVCTGLAVAFIWTYFPYPITTHRTLRSDLGATLYLLANFYSCIQTTVELCLHQGTLADPNKAKVPRARLDKARRKLFDKCVTMLSRLREHSSFIKFEPTFGGKFPKEAYDELIDSVQRIFNYMSITYYSSGAFASQPGAEENSWLKDFRSFVSGLNLTPYSVTSTLCLVSASMANAQPLPPYLNIPRPDALTQKMERVESELLNVRHVGEPCYAAFAVLETASILLIQETSNIVKKIQELMGEVNFSCQVFWEGSSELRTLGDAMEPKNDGRGADRVG
jgi:hypothetical protein